jgi:polyphosphate kinase 2 (PPK2 family)
MLESAEVGHRISKQQYEREEPKLREALLAAQWKLSRTGKGPVLLILSGVEGGGRGETANKLTEWMDPRHIRVVAFGPRTGDELVRPLPWRYWRALPARGHVGIFMNAWYNEALLTHVTGKTSAGRLELQLESIRHHERMLVEEGTVLLKFWIHLSKKEQKRRLERLEKDPRTRWRVTRRDWDAWRLYSKSHDLWEEVLRESSSGEAPWCVVEGTDDHYRELTVGRLLLDAMHAATATKARPTARKITPTAPSVIDNVQLIRELDLSKKLAEKAYDRDLEKYQGDLAQLARRKRFGERSLILVFEGVDAAGKGGAIRRVTAALDARQYVTVPVAAPSDEERAHPYLWRFWRNAPPFGGIAIFDRSWYGPRARRARRRLCDGVRLDARLRRDQPVRGAVDRRRRDHRQVLAADQQGRTAAALSFARKSRVQAIQDHA